MSAAGSYIQARMQLYHICCIDLERLQGISCRIKIQVGGTKHGKGRACRACKGAAGERPDDPACLQGGTRGNGNLSISQVQSTGNGQISTSSGVIAVGYYKS